jgi:PncC family amidohydrolase
MTAPVTSAGLAEAAMQDIVAARLTVVTAESCTAGAVALALSQVKGAGDHLHGGFVTYTKTMKRLALGVPAALLDEKGAVCAEVAQAMAAGALNRVEAGLAVAVTGVAGPKPDEDGNPVGLVYIGGASAAGRVCATRHMFTGRGKSGVIEASVEAALTLLRELCREPAC